MKRHYACRLLDGYDVITIITEPRIHRAEWSMLMNHETILIGLNEWLTTISLITIFFIAILLKVIITGSPLKVLHKVNTVTFFLWCWHSLWQRSLCFWRLRRRPQKNCLIWHQVWMWSNPESSLDTVLKTYMRKTDLMFLFHLSCLLKLHSALWRALGGSGSGLSI